MAQVLGPREEGAGKSARVGAGVDNGVGASSSGKGKGQGAAAVVMRTAPVKVVMIGAAQVTHPRLDCTRNDTRRIQSMELWVMPCSAP